MWTKWKNFLWQERGIWIAAPCVTLVVLLLRFSGLLQGWEWASFDQLMRLRPPEPRDERVAIVGINESDYRQLGQAVIPDAIYAQVLKKIARMQPRAIGLDIYRDQPAEPGHQELVEVFNSTDNIIGIQKVIGNSDLDTIDPPPALQAKGQVGANDLVRDADDEVRRGFISIDNQTGETIPSFSFYLALMYLDAEGIVAQDLGNRTFRLNKATFAPFQAHDGSYIRADAGGYQVFINYRGGRGHFETVSLYDILEDRVPPDWGRDRIILIGAVSESSNDLFSTPYSSGLLTLPEPMAGVEIHANLISQMISAAMENRSLIKSWNEPTEWLWVLLWATIGSILTWSLRHQHGGSVLAIRRSLHMVLAACILVGISYVAFIDGWWLPLVPSFIALTGAEFTITAYIARTAGDIRKTFGRYLSDEIVATLLEDPEGLKLGGERRKITILTSDLRGFTATSERLPPEEVVKVLNFYLGHMADVITRYQGTIDEFMGDGILVLFGAPIARKNDAQRALACAVDMQLAISQVNKQMKAWGLPPLEMGIGIHTGEVVVGNIGSEKRAKYGVVGSQVNLTYRIESYTIGGQIFISQATLQEVDAKLLRIDGQKEVQPKGVKTPIKIYDIGGIAGKYNLYLKKEQEEFITLSDTLALKYTILEGKHVGENVFDGCIVQLSAHGAEIYTKQGKDSVPSKLTNIKLNLLSQDHSRESEDIYAKVLEYQTNYLQAVPEDENYFLIRFTAKPPDVAAQLEKLYQSLKAS